ncbi:hypothetical protein FDECE_11094 [Fusarium decemcellulare]|nr:hypothetical protein FDECE_11094 [Fusarium decemcellulare]
MSTKASPGEPLNKADIPPETNLDVLDAFPTIAKSDTIDVFHDETASVDRIFAGVKDLYGDLMQDFETVEDLINNATTLFKGENNINVVQLDSKETLVVVGDIHGRFWSLRSILHEHPPSATTLHLFNGDMVDKGPSSLECIFLIFALKCKYPSSVFVNRGNHEDDYTNNEFGFRREVRLRAGSSFPTFYQSIQACFLALPLGLRIQTVDRAYLAVHAGIPFFERHPLSLDDIQQLDRQVSCSDRCDSVTQILWNVKHGSGANGSSLHGTSRGQSFGGEIITEFCDTEKLNGIIRGHEAEPRGWELDGRCLTVNSASDGFTTCLVIKGNNHRLEINTIEPTERAISSLNKNNQYRFMGHGCDDENERNEITSQFPN